MSSLASKPVLLIISQVYVPDPASVGQHMADVAEAMAKRGYMVQVLTSARGYENPHVKYPRRERRGGVDVRRLPLSSFGKKTLIHRILGQGLFLFQVIVRGLLCRRLSGILISTSPPMGSLAAILIGFVRQVPITYWLMDMNPDQVLVMGKVSPLNPLVWASSWLNRRIFARAAAVVVLDRFMAERVRRQYHCAGRLEILPPWPHADALFDVPRDANPFVIEHKLADRFVVMYSGNHSPASPVTTLVDAALQLRDDTRFIFLFIGGGLGKRAVDEAIANHRPPNILSLPYQPLEQIQYSLSAADLHVVTLGGQMAGIIHPCKIYGAMAVGRPILFIGPRPSHAADLVDRHDVGWQVEHGDIGGLVDRLERIVELQSDELAEMGDRARAAVREGYSKHRLCESFCAILDSAMMPSLEAGMSTTEISSRLRTDPSSPVLARTTSISLQRLQRRISNRLIASLDPLIKSMSEEMTLVTCICD